MSGERLLPGEIDRVGGTGRDRNGNRRQELTPRTTGVIPQGIADFSVVTQTEEEHGDHAQQERAEDETDEGNLVEFRETDVEGDARGGIEKGKECRDQDEHRDACPAQAGARAERLFTATPITLPVKAVKQRVSGARP